MMLAEAVQIHPGQVVELKFAIPESMAEQISRSWKHNWFVRNMPECWKSFKNEILWEPSTYSIVTSDAADFTRADGGATSITPTGASVLSPQWTDGEMWVSQYVFIPEDVEEAVILPAGTTIGTVSLVSLATMNDPALVAVMEAAHEEAEAILKQAAGHETEGRKLEG